MLPTPSYLYSHHHSRIPNWCWSTDFTVEVPFLFQTHFRFPLHDSSHRLRLIPLVLSAETAPAWSNTFSSHMWVLYKEMLIFQFLRGQTKVLHTISWSPYSFYFLFFLNLIEANDFQAGAAQCLGEIYRLFGCKITAGLIETSSIVAKLMKYHEVVCFPCNSVIVLYFLIFVSSLVNLTVFNSLFVISIFFRICFAIHHLI